MLIFFFFYSNWSQIAPFIEALNPFLKLIMGLEAQLNRGKCISELLLRIKEDTYVNFSFILHTAFTFLYFICL